MKEYKNKQGQYHRTDGPAREQDNGTKQWWVNGKRHREDGPAYEDSDGTKEWYINGKRVYSDEVNNLSQFDVSELFKRSIIKYELAR